MERPKSPINNTKTVSPLADRFIRIAVKKDKITQSDFAFEQNVFLGNEILSNEEKNRIIAPDDKKNKKEPSIAAVILAAGVSSRARRNKLMVKIGGKPLFMKAVEAAVRSKASPVFVITGHDAENLEEHLENIDINIGTTGSVGVWIVNSLSVEPYRLFVLLPEQIIG